VSHEQPPQAPFDPLAPIDRREFLRSASQRALAAGVLAAGLAGTLAGNQQVVEAASPGPPGDVACPDLRVLAKLASPVEAKVQCRHCDCHSRRVITVEQALTARLVAAKCDETAHAIPEGSVLRVKITRYFRLFGPCATWVGSHTGRFEILVHTHPTSPATALVLSGTLDGTDGLSSDSRDQEHCCHPWQDEGALAGKGQGALRRCTLTGSYTSALGPLPVDVDLHDPEVATHWLCSPDLWRTWRLSLVGILHCPCLPLLTTATPVAGHR